MRRVVLLVLLALVLPLAAWANSSIAITNHLGTIAGSSSGLSLTGSVMISYGGIIGPNLGTVSFTTGAFASGDPQNGGTLAPGGTFTNMGNRNNGVPNGVIFQGTFTSATWTLVTLANGTHNYELIGGVVSTNGAVAATTQITINTGRGFFSGSVDLSSGDTNLTVPEPGTLGLQGTGLVGVAGALRRNFHIG